MKYGFKGFPRSRLAALLSALALWCCLPTAAHAQYPCGNGPGPGEVVVGQTPGSQAHAPVLLCQYVGEGSGTGSSDESPYRAPTKHYAPQKAGFMAAAYDVDTSSVWMSAGHKTLEAAKQRALAGCAQGTGGQCYIADTLSEFGLMYVAEDAMGLLWIKGVKTLDEKRGPVSVIDWNPSIELCSRNAFGCKFLDYIQTGRMPLDADPDAQYVIDSFPKGQLNWNRWALVARPEKTPAAAWQGKSWVSTGQQRSAAARSELLARCQADAGVRCAISAFAANGVLAQFIDGQGKVGWTSAVPNARQPKPKKKKALVSDDTSVASRVARACPAAAAPCKVLGTYDAATLRLTVVPDLP